MGDGDLLNFQVKARSDKGKGRSVAEMQKLCCGLSFQVGSNKENSPEKNSIKTIGIERKGCGFLWQKQYTREKTCDELQTLKQLQRDIEEIVPNLVLPGSYPTLMGASECAKFSS